MFKNILFFWHFFNYSTDMCCGSSSLHIILKDFSLLEKLSNQIEMFSRVPEKLEANLCRPPCFSLPFFGLTLNQKFEFFSWLICNQNNKNNNHFSHSLFALNLNQKLNFFSWLLCNKNNKNNHFSHSLFLCSHFEPKIDFFHDYVTKTIRIIVIFLTHFLTLNWFFFMITMWQK
jgi:hypothetical protein